MHVSNPFYSYIGHDDDDEVFEAPAVELEYDCRSKSGRICVEWCNAGYEIPLAYMFIKNFKSNDETQYTWYWQHDHVRTMKKNHQHDQKLLNAFINHSSKIENSS